MMQDSSRTREKKLGGGLRYISGINHFPLLAPLVVQGLRLSFESGIATNYFIWIQSLNTGPLLYGSFTKSFFIALISQPLSQNPFSQSEDLFLEFWRNNRTSTKLGVSKTFRNDISTNFIFLNLTKSAVCGLIGGTSVYFSEVQAW